MSLRCKFVSTLTSKRDRGEFATRQETFMDLMTFEIDQVQGYVFFVIDGILLI